MNINLKGKQALVTGASSGIGFAIAAGLTKAGAAVTIISRDEAKLKNAVDQLNGLSEGGPCDGISADAGTAEGCEKVIAHKPEVDILVNNLGIYSAVPFFEIDDQLWQEIFQVNVMSGIRLARHYAKYMQKVGWGRIQFISSESAVNIPADMLHYGASKAAVQAVSRGLAKVLAGSGVTVNSVLPGPTLTENLAHMLDDMAQKTGQTSQALQAEFLQKNRPTSLIKRFASPQEVANLCVYVASEEASATTGAALRVEGGIVESIL